jgi:hypothetical protein
MQSPGRELTITVQIPWRLAPIVINRAVEPQRLDSSKLVKDVNFEPAQEFKESRLKSIHSPVQTVQRLITHIPCAQSKKLTPSASVQTFTAFRELLYSWERDTPLFTYALRIEGPFRTETEKTWPYKICGASERH